ncbi:transcription termination factor Rho [Rubellicoccus peritrichatus]|uniref:Transcription termination factor Rho n=2 Tax=Rubellicoccus peritrichatus TaxID=3080537 RepID=A0AAQ3LFQ2_9BACT|nr:transcription termination factor Rho [Puniceicoccus sp. CR14]WOO43734.1 transcription termination factor Rho [Puniceicoccus sp. CR14]
MDEPAPKKKVARKRAAKKAATKVAKKAAKKATKKAAKKAVKKAAEPPAEASAPVEVPAPAPKPEKEDIPEVFSASPDDIDDYGDVKSRKEREAKEAPVEETPAESGERSEAKGGDESPKQEAQENPSKEGGQQKGGERRHDGSNQGGGRNNRNDRGDRGGNPNDRGNRKNRFDRFKGKKQQHPNQNPNQHQKGNKFKKGGKKSSWQGAAGFAAAADDLDPPSFESLVEWDLFKTEESLDTFISENFDAAAEPLNYNEIYDKTLKELEEAAAEAEVTWDGLPSRSKIVRAFLDKARTDKRPIRVTGTAEILETGYGFLVFERDNLRLKTESPFISAELIKRLGIQRGHKVDALMNAPKEAETCPFVLKVDSLMDRSVEEVQHLTPFTELTPYYPTERIVMESAQGALGKWDNISMRVVDLLSPVGLGQRGLIVAPPRTGKTVLLQGIANAIRVNKPDVHLIILLVDERPEEVTDFKRSVSGAEVVSSTFDESAESHVHAAEMVIEKSRRMVECGKDVIILLDSITRLARAYNTMMPSSGKILSGGVEASALQKPKRFFGSARNIEEGGSLTILGTALVDTGSKMDEVIFEEFKGTGNMELHLDRELSNKRIFPSLSFERSGTRKEELLYHPDEMMKVYALRRAMKGVPSTEAMEMLIGRVKKTKTNAEFLMGMSR